MELQKTDFIVTSNNKWQTMIIQIGYLADIFLKMNEVNLSLQGK